MLIAAHVQEQYMAFSGVKDRRFKLTPPSRSTEGGKDCIPGTREENQVAGTAARIRSSNVNGALSTES
jgi:hypothetical protein